MIPNLIDSSILLIDDDKASLLLLREFFEPTGATLYMAADELELFEALENKPVDILLLDIRFGKSSGLELLPVIRNKYPGKIIIAQTAYALSDDEDFFLSVGFDGYISKPIRFDVLMTTVCNVLNKLAK